MTNAQKFVYELNVKCKTIEKRDSDYIVTIESNRELNEGAIYGAVIRNVPGENKNNLKIWGNSAMISVQNTGSTSRNQIVHIGNAIKYTNDISLRSYKEEDQKECPHGYRNDVIIDFVPGRYKSYIKIQETCQNCSLKLGDSKWIVQTITTKEVQEKLMKNLIKDIEEANRNNQNQYIIQEVFQQS